MYVIILNFGTGEVDSFYLPTGIYDVESYIEEQFEYNLSNCQWMATDKITFNRLNFY